jgi:hypothetical protein
MINLSDTINSKVVNLLVIVTFLILIVFSHKLSSHETSRWESFMIDSINIINTEKEGMDNNSLERPLHLTKFLLGSLPAYLTF